jgi:hypothetical protein
VGVVPVYANSPATRVMIISFITCILASKEKLNYILILSVLRHIRP